MVVEWEVTLECNYNCFYCTNLDPSILPKDDIEGFIKMISETYDVELFVFGGEPFVHPQIEYIIETLNKYKVDYVIQTNLSKKSVHVMNRIAEPFKINVSVHPTEVSREVIVECFNKVPDNVQVKTVDVMYTGKEAIDYYIDVKDFGDTYLTPIADFGDGISGKILEEYNAMRHTPIWNKVIRFEDIKKMGEWRSDLWENFSPKGKPCLYYNEYFLYGPNLELYNCCYREKHDGTCKHDKCFLM
jgi:molybdenum cofactor biosynthesis enzyme MoaA